MIHEWSTECYPAVWIPSPYHAQKQPSLNVAKSISTQKQQKVTWNLLFPLQRTIIGIWMTALPRNQVHNRETRIWGECRCRWCSLPSQFPISFLIQTSWFSMGKYFHGMHLIPVQSIRRKNNPIMTKMWKRHDLVVNCTRRMRAENGWS